MSIDLDNPLDELVQAIQEAQRKVKKIIYSIKGSDDFKRGYRAYLEGFELTDDYRKDYTMYRGDYSKGYDAAKKKYPNRLD